MVVSPAVLSAILGDNSGHFNGGEEDEGDSMEVVGGGGAEVGAVGVAAPPAGGDMHKHHLRQQVRLRLRQLHLA
jgi:hypothetical protein